MSNEEIASNKLITLAHSLARTCNCEIPAGVTITERLVELLKHTEARMKVGWVRIDGLRYQSKQDIEIVLERDGMAAYIQYASGSGASLDDAWRRIEQSGVLYGVDKKAVERAYFRIGQRQQFAVGDVPKPGPDAYFKYWVDKDCISRYEQISDDGIPLNSILPAAQVKAGEPIVERIPFEYGAEGTDVLGLKVAAVAGNDIVIPIGNNIDLQGNFALAACDGMAQFLNGEFSVIPLKIIDNDIEAADGRIEFDGNVIVNGSLLNGANLHASGHVEICGGVLGGEVTAGSVNVHQGIQKRVNVERKLTANFAENAIINSDDSVYIRDIVYHSKVAARRRVFVVGGKGVIVGGKVMAGEEIRCTVAGADVGVSTDLHVGIDAKLREEALQIRSDIQQLEVNLQQVHRGLDKLRGLANINQLTPENRALQLQLTKTQFRLQSQLDQNRLRQQELSEQFNMLQSSVINIKERVYPGVKISVGRRNRLISREMKFVRFSESEEGINITPYKVQ